MQKENSMGFFNSTFVIFVFHENTSGRDGDGLYILNVIPVPNNL